MDKINNCAICGRKSVFYSNYLKQHLCKKHFERMLIRRVRSNIISNGLRGKTFKVMRENKYGYAFLSFLFVDNKYNEEIKLKSYTLEDFAIEVMKFFLFSENKGLKVKGDGFFSPLFNISENEIYSFFLLKRRDIGKRERKGMENAILNFILKLEERRPGAMISIVKAGLDIGII